MREWTRIQSEQFVGQKCDILICNLKEQSKEIIATSPDSLNAIATLNYFPQYKVFLFPKGASKSHGESRVGQG